MKLSTRNHLTLTAILLSACASQHPAPSDNHTPIPTTSQSSTLTSVTYTQLPNSHQWQCTDGSHIETHLNGKQLTLNYHGQTQQLTRDPAAQPAIYQNSQLMFSSDGQNAVIGQPYSGLIYTTCTPY